MENQMGVPLRSKAALLPLAVAHAAALGGGEGDRQCLESPDSYENHKQHFSLQ